MTRAMVAEPILTRGWFRIGMIILATALVVVSTGLLLISERALSINIILHRLSLWPTPTLNGKKVTLGRDWYPFIQDDANDASSSKSKLHSATFLRVSTSNEKTPTSVTLFFSEESNPNRTVERVEQWPRLGRVMFLDIRQTKKMVHHSAWIEREKIFVSADSEDDLRMALRAIDEQN